MKLRTKILLIALLPVFLLGIGIFLLAADRTANGIYDQAYAGMEAAALAVRDIFEAGNDGPYQTDEKGDLWKGTGLNISNAFEIVDHIKDNTDMDVTIFWGDTRILTSIKDRTGEVETVRTSIGCLEQQTSLTKESVDKISSATDFIAAIASQTRLLSLNASIESARAGELGKGFGVVAAEIQKLSVQANAAVDDIRIIVTDLIENSSEAVQRMQEVQSIIIHQALNIQKTGQVFEAVKDGIQTSTEHIRTIITKADQMEEVREDMIDAVQSSAAAA